MTFNQDATSEPLPVVPMGTLTYRSPYIALAGYPDPGAGTVIPQPGTSLQSDQPLGGRKAGKKPRERWTNDEHERFLEGLKMFHRDWRSIEKHVGTKTAVQIRSHAQKFFAKAEREPGTVDFALPPPRPKRKPVSNSNVGLGSVKPGMVVTQCQDITQPSSQIAVSSAAPNNRITSRWLPANGTNSQSPTTAKVPGPSDMMNKIAAAAIAAASTTAHAVISAAGPEYLQVIQDLAKHDQRLSFLSCPITDLVSSFAAQGVMEPPACGAGDKYQPDALKAAHSIELQHPATRQPAQHGMLPVHVQANTKTVTPVTAGNPARSGSALPGTSSIPDPPVHLLNQLLSVPQASSQLIVDHLAATDISQPPDLHGSVPSTTGMTDQLLLPPPNDSLAGTGPETATHAAPLTALTPPTSVMPNIQGSSPMIQAIDGPWVTEVVKLNSSDNVPPDEGQQPASSQARSAQVPMLIDGGLGDAQHVKPWLSSPDQQQYQSYPQECADAQAANGYGEQGSGGGSRGNSGGDMNGSGDKSGSKSAKQSGNKLPDQSNAAPLHDRKGGAVPQSIPISAMHGVPLLHPHQGRLSLAQRAEFYKQYYHEMIRRGTEGLRNMNVQLCSNDLEWMGHDGLARNQGAMAGTEAKNGENMRVSVEGRHDAATGSHPWSSRKKQRTADTTDVHKATLSNACKQPASIMGMLPCAPEADIFPLDPERVLEFHKGSGWAIEVEQQDTATSAQGASRDGTAYHDTSHARVQTSGQLPAQEINKSIDAAPVGRNAPNSSGEGSNEPGPGSNDNDDGTGDAQPAALNADNSTPEVKDEVHEAQAGVPPQVRIPQ